jgi:hypothetical protein
LAIFAQRLSVTHFFRDGGISMGLFKRIETEGQSSSGFPSNFRDELDEFARWRREVNPSESPRLDLGKMYEMAEADRDGFLRDLAVVALPDGEWVVLGAKNLLLEILPIGTANSDFDSIVLAAFHFLRDCGVPPNRLSPNDLDLWDRLGNGEPWLYGLPIPTSGEGLADVHRDEKRLAARIARPDGCENQLFIRRNDSLQYVAVIEGPYSADDPTISSFEWYVYGNLHDLYRRVGVALQVPPMWALPELLSYVPIPPMRL